MEKRKYITITILVIFIFAIGIILFNKINRTSYALNIPAEDSVYKIYLEQNSNKIEIDGQDKINDIVNVIGEVKRTTTDKSVQDSPNVNNQIKVIFQYNENETTTVFVYKKDDKYIIEQPYNGIYRISPDEYNSVEKYMRD